MDAHLPAEQERREVVVDRGADRDRALGEGRAADPMQPGHGGLNLDDDQPGTVRCSADGPDRGDGGHRARRRQRGAEEWRGLGGRGERGGERAQAAVGRASLRHGSIVSGSTDGGSEQQRRQHARRQRGAVSAAAAAPLVCDGTHGVQPRSAWG